MFIRFSLYFFSFLTSESLVNDCAAELFGAERVNYIYAFGLLFTAFGYILFSKLKKEKLVYTGQALAIASLMVVCNAQNKPVFIIGAYVLLLSLGYIGAYYHSLLSESLYSKHFCFKTGVSTALGVFLQFIIQNHFSNYVLYILLMCFVCLHPSKNTIHIPQDNKNNTSNLPSMKIVIILISLMCVILGFQDSILTMENAKGKILLFSQVRLMYALGLVAAGAIADYKDRTYLSLSSSCAMVLSVVAISFFNSFTLSMSLMYLYSGFIVIYFTVVSMEIARIKNDKEKYSGMGRIVRCISTAIIVAITTLLNDHIPQNVYVVFSGILSIIIIVIMAFTGQFKFDSGCEQIEDISEKLSLANEKFSLTAKEREVLAKLVTSEATVQEIADEMGISRRVLQRHIASLYEKTSVQTRVGLLMVINRIQE